MQALWKGICPQKCLQESQEGKQKKAKNKKKVFKQTNKHQSAVIVYSSARLRTAAVAHFDDRLVRFGMLRNMSFNPCNIY